MWRFSQVSKHGLRDPKYAFRYLSWPPSLRCEQPIRARKCIFYFSLVSRYMHQLYSLSQAVDMWTMMIHSRLILYSPLDEALTVDMVHCYTHNLWTWARYPNVFSQLTSFSSLRFYHADHLVDLHPTGSELAGRERGSESTRCKCTPTPSNFQKPCTTPKSSNTYHSVMTSDRPAGLWRQYGATLLSLQYNLTPNLDYMSLTHLNQILHVSRQLLSHRLGNPLH